MNNENYQVNKTCDREEPFFSNQENAAVLYMNFLKSIPHFDEVMVGKEYTVDGHTNRDFPQYFGGSYINTDGNMVVVVSENIRWDIMKDEEWYKDLVSRIGSGDFVVRQGTHSYASLIETASEIVFGELRQHLNKYSFNGLSIKSSENCVQVFVKNEEDIGPVTEVLKGKPCCVVRKDVEFKYTIGLYCGEGVRKNPNSDKATFSVAFRVKKTVNYATSYGFLTCGHAFNGASSNVYLPTSQTGLSTAVLIGTVSSAEQQSSGNTDAAVIRINGDVTPSNSIFGTVKQIHAGYFVVLQEGNTVCMRGSKTGYSTGTVDSPSASVITEGDSYYDMVIATYGCDYGDSGGAVFSQPNAYQFAYAVGIQSAILGNGDAVYTKVGNAINTIGFALY